MAESPAGRLRRLATNRLGAAGRTLAVVALVAASTTLGGCGQEGIPTGTAFKFPNPISVGARSMPPGARLGFLAEWLQNTSSSSLTVDSLSFPGTGLGTVARIAEAEIAAPVTLGCSPSAPPHAPFGSCGSKGWVPNSLYVSDPPVYAVLRKGLPKNLLYRAGCYLQPLVPVKAYVLRPGHYLRFWVVVEMLRPGRWRAADHVLYYTQNGVRYRQVIPLSYYGSVRRAARWPRPDNEGPCMPKLTALGSQPLNPGHT